LINIALQIKRETADTGYMDYDWANERIATAEELAELSVLVSRGETRTDGGTA
jgi:hypothetical protein